jgi:hypothetical protein
MRTIIGNQIKLNQNPNDKIKKNNNENDKKKIAMKRIRTRLDKKNLMRLND